MHQLIPLTKQHTNQLTNHPAIDVLEVKHAVLI